MRSRICTIKSRQIRPRERIVCRKNFCSEGDRACQQIPRPVTESGQFGSKDCLVTRLAIEKQTKVKFKVSLTWLIGIKVRARGMSRRVEMVKRFSVNLLRFPFGPFHGEN